MGYGDIMGLKLNMPCHHNLMSPEGCIYSCCVDIICLLNILLYMYVVFMLYGGGFNLGHQK